MATKKSNTHAPTLALIMLLLTLAALSQGGAL